MTRILFFSKVREAAACAETTWPISEPQREESLWQWLATQYPRIAPLRQGCRVARNGEYLTPGGDLHPGDEIAIIPPVSGG